MKFISKELKATWFIRSFGLSKVPLIFYCRPTVVKLTEETTVIKIPFKRRNKNHLKSMYFGALAVGADVSGGVLAMHLISKSGRNISLVFKDFKADFLKRPEGDTHFTCNDGLAVRILIDKAIKTGERVDMPLKITATVPEISGNEPVAEFILTLSLKDKSNRAGIN
ncbi:PaaI family thioesterase [Candidatus Neomarinimicrobiota bacterium]